MNDKKTPLIAIIGPTAVGKTEFSLELAQKLNAEIISVDSRQVYRYLNVGTDKVNIETRKEIPHHLIDVVDPDQIYSAADFAKDTNDAIIRIKGRGKIPLLIGGSALYYKALEGALSKDLPKDNIIRDELKNELEVKGLQPLYGKLQLIDPTAADKIHPNDHVRIMRALEVYRITGKPISWWYSTQERNNSQFDIMYIGLIRDRSTLYNNIENRVKIQFASGYPEEVEWLLNNGYSPNLPSMQGFGYKELVLYIRGKMTLYEAIQGDIKSTKIFSRRQMTWFKHFLPVKWYNLQDINAKLAVEDAYSDCICHVSE
ncbi:MAG: tRNA (adenosine(37)-N6)-dimethylallyltransferase MiaA [Synergistaceae bacterium]